MFFNVIICFRHIEDEMEEQYEEDDDLSLHDAIMMSHQTRETEGTDTGSNLSTVTNKRKPIKPDSYFSDEDANSD